MTARSNEVFFERKKPWSGIKDDLLRCYLKPYITKILIHGGPVRYIDCFAGAGKFEDGSDGSPLIALKEIREAVEKSHAKNKDVKLYFIEKSHSETLKNVLGRDPLVGDVIGGRFEEDLIPLASRFKYANMFLYIDPFGVKLLDSRLLDELKDIKFDTMELLVNFNSFGFFRWACAHENVGIDSVAKEGYELHPEDSGERSCFDDNPNDEPLNNVLGCSEWKDVVAKYRIDRELDPDAGKRAVEEIAYLYWKCLKGRFEYVLEIPICVKSGGKTEYHMFFATNHEDGAILMGDSMGKRYVDMENIIKGWQLTLFDDCYDPTEDVLELLRMLTEKESARIPLKRFMALFYENNSDFCTEKCLKGVLRDLEDKGSISVIREPKITKTGKESTFWDVGKDRKLWISIK